MYIVPMEIPKYCNNRPFWRANYTYPLWGMGKSAQVQLTGKKIKEAHTAIPVT